MKTNSKEKPPQRKVDVGGDVNRPEPDLEVTSPAQSDSSVDDAPLKEYPEYGRDGLLSAAFTGDITVCVGCSVWQQCDAVCGVCCIVCRVVATSSCWQRLRAILRGVREGESECAHVGESGSVFVFFCVCGRERAREGAKARERESDGERIFARGGERARGRVCVCESVCMSVGV